MGRVICIDGRGQGDVTKTHELWRCDGIDAGYASPLLHGGRLYVMSNSGVLHCFDAVSGKKYWQFVAGRIGKGSPVWADGKIYLTTANGTFVILEDKGDSCREDRLAGLQHGRGRGHRNLQFAGNLRRPHRLLHHDRNDLLRQARMPPRRSQAFACRRSCPTRPPRKKSPRRW